MKNLIALSIAFLGLLSANIASAADAMNFRSLGFSADGRYYSFIESVIQDGSGFPSARGSIIDVTKNSVVKFERVVLQDDSGSEKQAVQQLVAKLAPAKYGIDMKHMGKTLWQRLPTDMNDPELHPRFSLNYGVDAGASSVWPKFNLDISEKTLAAVEACAGYESALLKVSLTEVSTSKKIVLQSDSRLPQSRQCASAYQPRQIIENNGAIVVVIRYNTLGFEGPDYNHLVVTASNVLK